MAETVPAKKHSPYQASRARRRFSWQRTSFFSPRRMVLFMALAIFLCETLNMALLAHLSITPVLEAFVDSSLLLLLLTPFYLIFYRPFWEEHQQFAQEVRFLSRKLMTSMEVERKRLGQDIHDQYGQTLTALQFEMEVLRKGLDEKDVQHQQQTREISKLLARLSNDLREVIYQLRPADLDEMGLMPALRTLLADFSKLYPDIKVSEGYDGTTEKLTQVSETKAVALYRICQEGLNNISKHAQATEVSVHVEVSDPLIVLEIKDNGVGFDVGRRGDDDQQRPRGIGLLGIRERVAEFGGRLILDAEPGKGSHLRIEMPMQ